MSEHTLTCLAPMDTQQGVQVLVFYGFRALDIEHIVSDLDDEVSNPLGFHAPFEFYIQRGTGMLPLGEQVRFVRLEDRSRLSMNPFLLPWAEKCGLTDMYMDNQELYLVFSLDKLLQEYPLHQRTGDADE